MYQLLIRNDGTSKCTLIGKVDIILRNISYIFNVLKFIHMENIQVYKYSTVKGDKTPKNSTCNTSKLDFFSSIVSYFTCTCFPLLLQFKSVSKLPVRASKILSHVYPLS